MTKPAETAHQTTVEERGWSWIMPFGCLLLIGGYFIVRSRGLWAETDSAVFAKAIRGVKDSGQLVPPKEFGELYPNGYLFQALSTFICHLTGLDVLTLQQHVYPFLAALVVLPAWCFFRELTDDARGATFTTLLLLTQPEFLFVILRSSHEKITRFLILLSLYLLFRSFRYYQNIRLFSVHVIVFYCTIYALIASNNLLAHSFIVAILLALGFGHFLRRRIDFHHATGSLVRRLGYITIICLGIVYLFTFYLYTPAKHDLVVLKSVVDRFMALFLNVEHQTTNAYTYVDEAWINLPSYLIASSANWILLIGSALIWSHQGWRWLIKRTDQPTQTAWLVWLLYSAFALQEAFSIIADASGSIGNLQHRLFPSFAVIAVALTGTSVSRWIASRPRRRRVGLISVGLMVMVFLSALKATNEPLLSNKWIFYRPDELRALVWADDHLDYSEVWTEFDERLLTAFAMTQTQSHNHNGMRATTLRNTTRTILITDLTRLRSQRIRRPVPIPADAYRIYDNGRAQLYHLRSQTPFQR